MPDELLVLGSSSGVPTGRRFATAFALSVTSKLFLIDCGAPVSTLLYRYGLDPLDVQAVFLSHWHIDHVAHLGLFLSQNRLLRRSTALKIFGPRGTRGKIKRMLADSFLLPEQLRFDLNITNVKLDKTYKDALLRVSFFKTQHLERPSYKANFGRRAISCGMILRGPGWRIVYSGDLASSQELAPHIKGCDLLIHEMAHHQPEAVAEFVEAAQIPHVLINHLHPQFDETPDKIKLAFEGRYSGNLMVAEDGTKVQLNRLRKAGKIETRPSTGQPGPQRSDGLSPDQT